MKHLRLAVVNAPHTDIAPGCPGPTSRGGFRSTPRFVAWNCNGTGPIALASSLASDRTPPRVTFFEELLGARPPPAPSPLPCMAAGKACCAPDEFTRSCARCTWSRSYTSRDDYPNPPYPFRRRRADDTAFSHVVYSPRPVRLAATFRLPGPGIRRRSVRRATYGR